MQRDTITFRQYSAAAFVALFSPISRLLPKAVLELAGISGWVAAPLAYVPMMGLMWVMNRLLTVGGRSVGLADALTARVGKVAGKAVCAFLALWIVGYGGFLLRSGGERLLSTVYPTADLGFFMVAMMAASTVAAIGKLRYAVRSAVVIELLFALALVLIYLLALPNVELEYIWPVNVLQADRIALSVLPVVNVLSPWVYFTFLRGRVTEDQHPLRRSYQRLAVLVVIVLLFLITTVGILGPELSLRQQFPFFVMIKNLSLFNVMERFEPVVVVVWVMSDYVCITLLLLSVSTALQRLLGVGRRGVYVLPCAAGMLAAAFLMAPDAFQFTKLSHLIVPAANMAIVFLLFPFLLLLSVIIKKQKKKQKRC